MKLTIAALSTVLFVAPAVAQDAVHHGDASTMHDSDARHDRSRHYQGEPDLRGRTDRHRHDRDDRGRTNHHARSEDRNGHEEACRDADGPGHNASGRTPDRA
ncbi:hypothetical protein [Aureimonas sp. AU22]|uniref:hypothetical protein n=1 Tax=Aureimonas sp. AU22 TaxID=1638162 RepID=UPI000AC5556D|nr:hypothetical protein [Aureimonas sp. AU22]